MSRDTMLSALELRSARAPGAARHHRRRTGAVAASARARGSRPRRGASRCAFAPTSSHSPGPTPPTCRRSSPATACSLLASLPGTVRRGGRRAARAAPAFDTSLAVLRELAALGYGAGDGLTLDLAYNPPLGELARPESEPRRAVPHGTRAARCSLRLAVRDRERPCGTVSAAPSAPRTGWTPTSPALAAAFNPEVAAALECRHGLVVGWDGTLSDCDFNLGAGMGLGRGTAHARRSCLPSFERAGGAAMPLDALATRRIAFAPHCFACTAGAGSS